MANRWIQTRRYRCPNCHTLYLHDHAHRHQCYECPNQPALGPRPLNGDGPARDQNGAQSSAQDNGPGMSRYVAGF